MRALFVTSVFPKDYAKNLYGIVQRMRMLLDAIHAIADELEILFLTPADVATRAEVSSNIEKQLAEHWGIHCKVTLCKRGVQPKENLLHYLITCICTALGLRRHPNFRPFIGETQEEAFSQCMTCTPDIVFFQRIYATGPSISYSFARTRVFLDLDDVEHLRFAREIKQPPLWRSKRLSYLQVPALWKDERFAIVRSDSAFVCSENDRSYLQKYMRVRNIEVIPNSVQQVPDGPLSNRPNVLFIGNGLFGPNKVAVDYLISKVWPRLEKKFPSARLFIAGSNWDKVSVCKNYSNNIEFLGFVDDLNALYRKMRLICCPIQSGGGTRIKILEAANYGVPVVSTKIGAEGIDFKNDEEIMLRNDADSMAEACAALLVDDELAKRISIAARNKVRLLYSRDRIIRKIQSTLTDPTPICSKVSI